ncbi:MFS quinate transporter QutD [Moesziomyces antarcticus]|uniref:Related to quinate transport protein n=1 Tax=Pseudozyma antarctica TaxID=84753 RepID=A0A5C3FFK6_PSEA2|nr:MFS quinate transporter QutD [Moesziomyces antarcticus]GAK62621.1 MFS quinate transporter QutD [Moesziomyces antarcticus]SPO43182.1 related to quinate transport protein [Moesziomyces antarcticus]
MTRATSEGSSTPSKQEDNFAGTTNAHLVADKTTKRRFGPSAIAEDLRDHWRVYILGICASFGGLLFGWDTGLIGGVLNMPAFKKDFGLENNDAKLAALKGNIVSVLQAGCFFGAAASFYLPHRFGRKQAMLISATVFLIGSVIQTVCRLNGQSANAALNQLYVGRVIGGFGVGLASSTVPMYLSECAPRAIRGRLAGMYQLLIVTGICIAYFVNYGMVQNYPDQTSSAMWQVPFALQCLPGVLFVVTLLFQPESPRWLVEQQRNAEAQKSLARINRADVNDPVVVGILREIEQDLEGKSGLSLVQQLKMAFSDRVTTYRVFIGALLMFFQQFTGTNSINYYSPQIFKSLGITGQSSGLLATGVYGVVKIITTGLFMAVAIEQLGRKWCLIIGGLVQVFTLFWIAIYQAVRPAGTPVDGVGYLTIAMVYIFVVGYGLGWSSVTWAVSAEVAPNQLRALAMSAATMSQWFFNFVIALITPRALEHIKYGTFLLFGVMTSVAVVWAAFFLPESSGVTLELMHRIFEGNIISRSVQDLSPAKRKVFRARLLAEVGGTADDGMVNENVRANEAAFATLNREESYAAKKVDDDVVKTADAGDSDADHARK